MKLWIFQDFNDKYIASYGSSGQKAIFSFMNDRKLFSGLYDAVLYGFGPTHYYVDIHSRSV